MLLEAPAKQTSEWQVEVEPIQLSTNAHVSFFLNFRRWHPTQAAIGSAIHDR